MKWLWVGVAMAVAFAGCNGEGANGSVHDQFRSNVRVGISSMEYQFADLEPQTAERNGRCRQLIFELLALPENGAQSTYLSNELAAALAEGKSFRMYDRWLLLLGQDQLINHPPGDPTFLLGLADKVAASRQPGSPGPYQTTYASLAAGFLMRATDYSGRVDTYNDQIHSAQWEEFYRWLRDNRDRFIHDESIGKYRPRDQLPVSQPSFDGS